ncbi:MAG: acetyl-CoA carboxylase carboxyltransferase subunit beta [Firmicutes bacterium]|jgi:acetyl-CoA carboxylase carboxyl transferase subunit beta|nr:acetyl-CoA carboxylase carboxyltransferase subunit beta [Bacillota bacterium]
MLNVFRSKPKYMTVKRQEPERRPEVPDNLWTRCDHCSQMLYNKELEKQMFVCRCGHHFRLSAYQRLGMIADEDSFVPFAPLYAADPLSFPGYSDKIRKAQELTSLDDAILIGHARIGEIPVILGIIDFSFIGGSMGSVVGEQLTRGFERATAEQLPVVVFSGGGGGARMHEGIFSLMQMAKTAQAVGKHSRSKLLFISVLTHPTMGGVYASFASLGDIILAEPGALIGFAGPRIVEETTRQKLPPGFQTAEFALEHGMIDMIVNRQQMRSTVARLLRYHQRGGRR